MQDARTVSESGKHRAAGGDGTKPRVISGRGGTMVSLGGTAGRVASVPLPGNPARVVVTPLSGSTQEAVDHPTPPNQEVSVPPHTIQTGGQRGDFEGEETIAVPERDRLNLP
ncbi:hypothetical protein E2C01_091244 [Portunus trituberculatus]|uniref:Uncharacterized protein n=1 Tax=Portunus trituberculatus TaxID=210409 RepID=A0A5B7JH12_PORTR|nr:hypothetical protein [Portunus trituberculatus]